MDIGHEEVKNQRDDFQQFARSARSRGEMDSPMPSIGKESPCGVGAERMPELWLWGPAELVWAEGQRVRLGRERRHQLLVVLGMQAGEWVERHRVASWLWPNHSSSDALRNLRYVVHEARKLVPHSALRSMGPMLSLALRTDLQRLSSSLAEGQPLRAIAWRRGPLLAGMDDCLGTELSRWIRAQREATDAAWRRHAITALAALPARSDEARALASGLLSIDPLDQEAALTLVQYELSRGDRSAARARIRELEERLHVEPTTSQTTPLLQAATRLLADPASAEELPADDFIGRRVELAELDRRLRSGLRLVTVLGVGGIGKSALARRISAHHNAVWVELEDLRDTQGFLWRVGMRLGADLLGERDLVGQLSRTLARGPRRLLALDNAEHLRDLPVCLARMLAEIPALALLVTSRERLGLPEESVFTLGGLPCPDEDSRDAEAAAAFDAVRLFVSCARKVRPAFRLDEHSAAVVRIVEAVGGWPLAIKLAASWVRLLSPELIAVDLQSSLETLVANPGAGEPVRLSHASISSVIEASLSRLNSSDFGMLEALSVFDGGFTHEAARQVAGMGLPALASLADRGLVGSNSEGRFELHPLIAASLRRRLAHKPHDQARWQAGHAVHFASRLVAAERASPHDHRPLVQVIEAEYANLRTAWRHMAMREPSALLEPALRAWRRYFVAVGRFAEGIRQLEAAFPEGSLASAPRLWGRVRATIAWLAKLEGDGERAQAIATQVLDSVNPSEDPELEIDCLATLCGVDLLRCRWHDALVRGRRALERARTVGLRREEASALNNIGVAALCAGDIDTSLSHLERAAAIQHELGDHVSLARTMQNLGCACLCTRDWSGACARFEQGLRFATAHGVHSLSGALELLLGTTLIELGHLDTAEQHLNSARRAMQAAGETSWEFKASYYLLHLHARRGDPQATSRLLAAAMQAIELNLIYDLQYLAVFLAECLQAEGQPDLAARLFAAAECSRWADTYLLATAHACRQNHMPARSAFRLPSPSTPLSPDCADIERVIERLQR
jgi:DNA-binding SARP family transcriptional activator/tetratricopeptide (TPR) repeat protein